MASKRIEHSVKDKFEISSNGSGLLENVVLIFCAHDDISAFQFVIPGLT